MSYGLRYQIGALLIFLCIWLPAASAQEDDLPKLAPLPPGVPPIPGPKEKDNVLLLSAKNEAQFEDLLLAPLAAWLKDGKLAIRLVRNLEFRWGLTASWEDASKRNVLEYELSDDHSLVHKATGLPNEGTPFGDQDDISNEADPERKAYKILWNIAYLEGAARDVFYHMQMDWIGTQALLRSARGGVYRKTWFGPVPVKAVAAATTTPIATPAATASPSASLPPQQTEANAAQVTAPAPVFSGVTDVLRQDGLRLFAPPVVSGFSQFSWRYRGPQQDRIWLFSPVLRDLREQLPANRGDVILGGNLSYDDLFVWSTKIQSVHARVVDQKVLFVPVPSLNFYRLEAQPFSEQPKAELGGFASRSELPPAKEGEAKPDSALTVRGFHKRADGTSAMVIWNHQSRQLPQLAPWVPTTVSFVPRRTWIIEITPIDPYAVNGKEILIVDQESQLPVYKLVYDRIGEYRKTVIGAWGLARTKDGKVAFPFAAFVLALDQSAQSATGATTELVQTFLGKDTRPAVQLRTWLDPAKYAKKVVPKEGADREEAEEDEAADAEAPQDAPPAPIDD